jgi:hypothetical protein
MICLFSKKGFGALKGRQLGQHVAKIGLDRCQGYLGLSGFCGPADYKKSIRSIHHAGGNGL